jgi:hypothetical protein
VLQDESNVQPVVGSIAPRLVEFRLICNRNALSQSAEISTVNSTT